MRAIFVLLVLALGLGPAALPARADSDEARVLDALSSNDPATLAWAAWEAAEADMAAAAPRIAARLAGVASDDALGPALGNLMDAAIRLGALPDAEGITALARVTRHSTAALVCRHAHDRPDVALAAFDALPAGRAWIAVANMLSVRHVPGLAARLLTELEMLRSVQIRDVPSAPRPPPMGHVCWTGVGRRPEGFPPVVRYALSLHETGSLLSDGAHPVYVARVVFEEQKFLFGGIAGREPDPHECRVAWLDALLDREPPCHLWARDSIGLRYVGRQPFQREISRITNDVYTRYWAWARALLERGLLTDSEARSLTPLLRFEVEDGRADRRHPVPPPEVPAPTNPWLEPHRRPHPPGRPPGV